MASTQTLVLIGSGPMIGVSAASLFATRKFSNIALISRDPARLSNDRDSVLLAAKAAGKNINVRTFAADIKNTPAFERVLKEVETMGRRESRTQRVVQVPRGRDNWGIRRMSQRSFGSYMNRRSRSGL